MAAILSRPQCVNRALKHCYYVFLVQKVFHNKGDKSQSITDQAQFITYIKMPIMMNIYLN